MDKFVQDHSLSLSLFDIFILHLNRIDFSLCTRFSRIDQKIGLDHFLEMVLTYSLEFSCPRSD
jgi:hypothetical protein